MIVVITLSCTLAFHTACLALFTRTRLARVRALARCLHKATVALSACITAASFASSGTPAVRSPLPAWHPLLMQMGKSPEQQKPPSLGTSCVIQKTGDSKGQQPLMLHTVLSPQLPPPA